MEFSAHAGMADSKVSFPRGLWVTLTMDWGGWVLAATLCGTIWCAGRNEMSYHMVQYCISILRGIAIHCRAFSRIVHGIVLYGLILLIALSDIVGVALSRIVAHCCTVIVAHCSIWHCRALSLSHCRALSRIPKLVLSRIHNI